MDDFRVRRPTELIGRSDAIQRIRELARRAAQGDPKVLITGESGVGKEIVARYIHEQSARASRSFVPVNCAGLSEALLESELFGHVKGSFTGAYRDKIGRLQLAQGGSVLLDEFGEMSPKMQALLLRFLDNGEIQRVGSDGVSAVISVRVIAATNRDLLELVAQGRFREDLFYRIKVIHIHVPPLRERISDLRPLAAYLVKQMGRQITFTEAALEVMEQHRWPGNVRELQNLVEQVGWLTPLAEVGPEQLPLTVTAALPAKSSHHRQRARSVDDLYNALLTGQGSFWNSVYEPFLRRDLTRDDLCELIRRGLTHARGNYRVLLRLFGIPETDYKRLLNFLAAHDCSVDFRMYRPVKPTVVERESA